MKQKHETFRGWLKGQMRNPRFRKAYEEEELPARLALRIADLRAAQGLSQSSLARKLGVSQQALSLLENPTSARFTLRTLQRVATALKRELVVELR